MHGSAPFIFNLGSYLQEIIMLLKVTVSVLASDPPSKDGNVWFTTLTFKLLSDLELNVITLLKTELNIFNFGFSAPVTCANLLQEKNYELSESNTV